MKPFMKIRRIFVWSSLGIQMHSNDSYLAILLVIGHLSNNINVFGIISSQIQSWYFSLFLK